MLPARGLNHLSDRVRRIGTTLCTKDQPGFVLTDVDVSSTDFGQQESFLAGKLFQDHLARGGRRGRILPDFLIGAHAMLRADRLLTRDSRFFSDAFRDLQAITPAELLA